MIFGHRGLGTDRHNPPVPENSVESLVKAASLPFVSGVEFDVQILADGKLVVYHDLDFANKQLAELTLDEVKDVVCELKPVLSALTPLKKAVICELKYPPLNSQVWRANRSRAEMAEAVIGELTNSGIKDIYISSFDPEILVEVHKVLKRLSTDNIRVIFNCWFGHEEDGWEDHDFQDLRNRDPLTALDFAKSLARTAPVLVLETSWLLLNRWFMQRACREGVQIFTYGKGNSTRLDCQKQLSLGVTCVIADRVDTFDLLN